MIQPGIVNNLKANRLAPPGMYLIDEDGTEVLLPNKYVPEDLLIEDDIEVFLFFDSEDRLTATTATPKVQLHQIAVLEVVEVTPFGAFLDWGLEKDLLVPYGEQYNRMQKGKKYLVYCYYDEKSERLAASNRIQKILKTNTEKLKEGQKVNLLIGEKTDIGYRVLINEDYEGLIYANEVFKNIQPGDATHGFIKTIRADHKLDIALEKQGHQSIEPNAKIVLKKLKAAHGFLPIHDKSSPELIKKHLEMSKKAFKKAIGNLYKQRLIEIGEEGVFLKEG